MKRHAAFPDGKYFQRMGQVIAGLVEQYLPQSATDDHPEHAIEQQVVELLDGQQPRPGLDPVAAEHDELNESDQIHQAVPAHGKRAEREGDGIELRVEEHRRRRVG